MSVTFSFDSIGYWFSPHVDIAGFLLQREEGKAQSASLERTRSYGGVSASSSTDSISASNPSKKKTKPKVARPLPHKGNPSVKIEYRVVDLRSICDIILIPTTNRNCI